MGLVRKRIEGEDYLNNPESELRKKWHRELSTYFKLIAAECGAEKPSLLRTREARQLFIDRCKKIGIQDEKVTEIKSDNPF